MRNIHALINVLVFTFQLSFHSNSLTIKTTSIASTGYVPFICVTLETNSDIVPYAPSVKPTDTSTLFVSITLAPNFIMRVSSRLSVSCSFSDYNASARCVCLSLTLSSALHVFNVLSKSFYIFLFQCLAFCAYV